MSLSEIKIEKLRDFQLQELYNLMLMEDFPDTPSSYKEARDFLLETENYGIVENGRLNACFLFGDITDNSAFIDVVCRRNFRGKWATKKVLTFIFKKAFKDMNLKFIWAYAHNSKSLTAALKAGFVIANYERYISHKETPVLVLTKRNLNKYFLDKINKEDKDNGIYF